MLRPGLRFEKLTSLARKMLGVPIAFIELRGEQVADSGRTADAGGLQFLATCPLTCEGEDVGTLGVADYVPRGLTSNELASLRDLADLAEQEIRVAKNGGPRVGQTESEELQQRPLIDSLTRLWNRASIEQICARELEIAHSRGRSLSFALVHLDGLESIYAMQSKAAADLVMRATAERLRTALRATDSLGRYGPGEILVLLPGCPQEIVAASADRLRRIVSRDPVLFGGRALSITASVGATISEDGGDDLASLLRAAENAQHRAREAGGNRVEMCWLTASKRLLQTA